MNDHTTDASPDNSCFLYIIAQERSNFIKIGVTADIDARLAQLQTGNPQRLVIVRLFLLKDLTAAVRLEQLFHQRYQQLRVQGEWFRVSPMDLLSDINFALQLARSWPDVLGCSDFTDALPDGWWALHFNHLPLWGQHGDSRPAGDLIRILHSHWEAKKDGQT